MSAVGAINLRGKIAELSTGIEPDLSYPVTWATGNTVQCMSSSTSHRRFLARLLLLGRYASCLTPSSELETDVQHVVGRRCCLLDGFFCTTPKARSIIPSASSFAKHKSSHSFSHKSVGDLDPNRWLDQSKAWYFNLPNKLIYAMILINGTVRWSETEQKSCVKSTELSHMAVHNK